MLPKSIENLIEEFSRLPGIGPKTAARLTFWLVSAPDEESKNLGQALTSLKTSLRVCPQCFNFAESEICRICADQTRDRSQIIVVEEPLDLIALERAGARGLYHVLGGVISPIDGIGPENLRIRQLISRLEKSRGEVKELLIATNPSLEGEATSMYIVKEIERAQIAQKIGKKIKFTKLAAGLPVGSDLEYADEDTLSRAIKGRKEIV